MRTGAGPAFAVEPLAPADLFELRPRAYEKRFFDLIDDWGAYGQAIALPGHAFTARLDGAVLGCGGIFPLQRGVGEVWAALSEGLPIGVAGRPWALIDRAARRLLQGALGNGYHRLQTAIEVDFRPGHAWVRRLGFREEGMRKKYGADGQDYMRFARTV